MKPILVVLAVLAALVIGLCARPWLAGDAALSPPTNGAEARDLEALRAQVAALQQRLDALERVAPAAAPPARSVVGALPDGVAASAAAGERRDARWYLEQYVLSFGEDANGVEYYRLAVDAHSVELAAEIVALVRDGTQPAALRQALVVMLGKRRFAEFPEVLDALLTALRPPTTEALALRALDALTRIGSAACLPGLEAAIPFVREPAVRERAVALLVDLGGDDANAALLRLFAQARDDALRRLLVRHLNGGELAAALALLRAAAGGEQPVRLEAAHKVHEFDAAEFDAFVAAWRQGEADGEVKKALGDAAQPGADGWTAKKACGPPDADPRRDDPNAWAPQNPEMGRQWLQLAYANPMPATAVRIFEVNAPGAVVELLARGETGAWVSLWRGTADGAPSPLVLTFPQTAFAVRSLRLVLDTDRTPGWNEIDAVELLGPGGGQWAARALASSSYGGRRRAQSDGASGDFVRYENGLHTRR